MQASHDLGGQIRFVGDRLPADFWTRNCVRFYIHGEGGATSFFAGGDPEKILDQIEGHGVKVERDEHPCGVLGHAAAAAGAPPRRQMSWAVGPLKWPS